MYTYIHTVMCIVIYADYIYIYSLTERFTHKRINVKFTLFNLFSLMFVTYTYKCRIFHNFVLEMIYYFQTLTVERLRLLADEMADPLPGPHWVTSVIRLESYGWC